MRANGGSATAAEVVACVQRTLADGSARVAFEHEVPPTMWPRFRRRRGGLLVRGVTAAAKVIFRRAGFFPLSAIGVIEPARRRYRIDYGHYAEAGIEGRRWSGRSRRALSTLPPRGGPATPDVLPDVLWLLEVGRG